MSTRAMQQVDATGRPGNRLIDLRARARPVAVGARVIPVQLVVTDLTSELTGDFETQCEFLYDVYTISADPETDDALLEDVDPTALGHHHVRPTLGAMIAATFGYAHREDGDLKLGYINETQNPLGIPIPDEVGDFALTSIDGVLQWTTVSNFVCPV